MQKESFLLPLPTSRPATLLEHKGNALKTRTHLGRYCTSALAKVGCHSISGLRPLAVELHVVGQVRRAGWVAQRARAHEHAVVGLANDALRSTVYSESVNAIQ